MLLKSNTSDNVLEQEANNYSRYLLDRDPPKDMIERYIHASRKLGIDAVSISDSKIMEFSHAYPWTIPFLDAATGLMHPDALIRKKIYTMAAVLEASTLFTEAFLPRTLSPLSLFVRLISSGIIAGIKIIIGMPLLLYLRRCSHV